MDPGQPANLERFFAQYDRIRSHRHSMPHDQKEKPSESSVLPPSMEEPPSELPPSMEEPETMDLSGMSSEVPKQSWGDMQAERMAASEQRLNEHWHGGASFKEDEAGLDKAYQDATSTGTYYDPNTRSLYVKGTQTPTDVYDDFTKVPFGRVSDSQ